MISSRNFDDAGSTGRGDRGRGREEGRGEEGAKREMGETRGRKRE